MTGGGSATTCVPLNQDHRGPPISTAAIIRMKTNPTKTSQFSPSWTPWAVPAQSHGQRGRAVWNGWSCCRITGVGWLSGWILSTKGTLSENVEHNHSKKSFSFDSLIENLHLCFFLQQSHFYEFSLGEWFLNHGSQTTEEPGYWSVERDKLQNSRTVLFIGQWLHLMTYKEAWWLTVIHKLKIRNRALGGTVQSNVLDVSLQQNDRRLP